MKVIVINRLLCMNVNAYGDVKEVTSLQARVSVRTFGVLLAGGLETAEAGESK